MLCYRAVSVTRVPAVNDFACTGNSGIMMLIQALDTKQVLQLQYKQRSMDFCQKFADWVCCCVGINQERSRAVLESHWEDINGSIRTCFNDLSTLDWGDKKLNEEQGTTPGRVEIQETVETRTHISAIPPELVVSIFKRVVSTDPDMKSIEQLALVCKGFYACARDAHLWKLACQRVWGVNCDDPVQWNGSWRRMYINRPHLLFAGVYISKFSYVREGENSHHVVNFYRYKRFCVNGTVLIYKGIDKPADVIAQRKLEYCNRTSVFVGHYGLCGDKVIITVPTQVTAQMNAHPSQQAFQMELQISGVGRRHHNQLKWLHYSVSTTYRSSGQTVLSQIDLNDQFPPFHFLPVKFQ